MNKLETKHFKVIDDNVGGFQSCNDTDPILLYGKETSATSCAEITKEYAMKFDKWKDKYNWELYFNGMYYVNTETKQKATPSQLWNIFLNDLGE